MERIILSFLQLVYFTSVKNNSPVENHLASWTLLLVSSNELANKDNRSCYQYVICEFGKYASGIFLLSPSYIWMTNTIYFFVSCCVLKPISHHLRPLSPCLCDTIGNFLKKQDFSFCNTRLSRCSNVYRASARATMHIGAFDVEMTESES